MSLIRAEPDLTPAEIVPTETGSRGEHDRQLGRSLLQAAPDELQAADKSGPGCSGGTAALEGRTAAAYAKRLVFIDETGTSTTMVRTTGATAAVRGLGVHRHRLRAGPCREGQGPVARVADQLRPKVSKLASFLDEAEMDVLAYMNFPAPHRAEPHSTQPFERLNGEIKRRADIAGIFPNEDAIVRLGAILLEQNDEWGRAVTSLDDAGNNRSIGR